ncbi:carbohydrate kinase family protein [Streptomyces boninensis]|uniref:carbohydrate kinase family protein n=1 Tax=Streptomyces boninensis TaxID=2039455 RepID=UPI003B218909
MKDPIAVLGECVADAFVTPGDPTDSAPGSGLGLDVLPGGGPANTAVALARLGTPARFLGRLSGDVFGTLFRDRLTAAGVDLTSSVRAQEPSTLAIAALDGAGRADYSFHAEGAADWQWTAAELRAAMAAPLSCLHTGSLALVRAPGATPLENALSQAAPRATISLDPNVRPLLVDPAIYRARLPRWCALTDILRLSDDDLAHVLPGAGPAEAADRFHAWGAPLVVITLGASGAFASLAGTRLHVPAPTTQVVDTVGAGDAFMAGFLHVLHTTDALGSRLHTLTTQQLEPALHFAVRVAAAVCGVRGADLPAESPLHAA